MKISNKKVTVDMLTEEALKSPYNCERFIDLQNRLLSQSKPELISCVDQSFLHALDLHNQSDARSCANAFVCAEAISKKSKEWYEIARDYLSGKPQGEGAKQLGENIVGVFVSEPDYNDAQKQLEERMDRWGFFANPSFLYGLSHIDNVPGGNEIICEEIENSPRALEVMDDHVEAYLSLKSGDYTKKQKVEVMTAIKEALRTDSLLFDKLDYFEKNKEPVMEGIRNTLLYGNSHARELDCCYMNVDVLGYCKDNGITLVKSSDPNSEQPFAMVKDGAREMFDGTLLDLKRVSERSAEHSAGVKRSPNSKKIQAEIDL